MGILLAFAPFILFVIVEKIVGTTAGLLSAAIVSAALVLRDTFSKNRSAKVLEIGTLILFGGLAIYAAGMRPAWPIAGVRLRVDAGLLLVVLVSMAIRRPFTLQCAREETPPELWNQPEFVRVNYIITAVWALAFVVMVAADLVLFYVPGLRPSISIIATIAAIYGAIKFTSWYPEREQAKAD